MIGNTLGHYKIISLLGKGGMGEVYRVRDTRLGRDVALKILRTGMTANPTRLARIRQEARIVARLSHPNRDPKPANIMLAKDGRVKVLDFGLARFAEQPYSPDEPDTRVGIILYETRTML